MLHEAKIKTQGTIKAKGQTANDPSQNGTLTSDTTLHNPLTFSNHKLRQIGIPHYDPLRATLRVANFEV